VRPAKVNAKVLKDFLKNAELAAINKVLGLQFGVTYTADNVRRLLRYDHFVIFCDQVLRRDVDVCVSVCVWVCVCVCEREKGVCTCVLVYICKYIYMYVYM